MLRMRPRCVFRILCRHSWSYAYLLPGRPRSARGAVRESARGLRLAHPTGEPFSTARLRSSRLVSVTSSPFASRQLPDLGLQIQKCSFASKHLVFQDAPYGQVHGFGLLGLTTKLACRLTNGSKWLSTSPLLTQPPTEATHSSPSLRMN
jgi:hypothetical protein